MRIRNIKFTLPFLLLLPLVWSCDREMANDEPDYPTEPIVFDDGFVAGLNYAAFGDSKVTAFEVDEDVSYEGTASMRFDVPNEGDSDGGYAGGVYYTTTGRNLSSYNALTFWVKASQSASIDLLGFGNDLAESNFQVTIQNLLVDTKWTKVIIPIPDPSKLVAEKGMFFYADAPDDGKAYTYWIDEVSFENLGTIAHPQASIQGGADEEVQLVTGTSTQISGLSSSFNMPNGIDQSLDLTAAYFTFLSSNSSVATVGSDGTVTVHSSGTSVITAMLGDVVADGSLTVESIGDLPLPTEPTVPEDSVISLFSNSYTDVTVDTWNPFWEFSTTQLSDFAVNGNDLKLYTQLNFVGIVFSSSLIDGSEMTHLHIDVLTQDEGTALEFTVELVDFGADGVFGGGDDSSLPNTTTLNSGEWTGIDIELTNLTSRANLAQLVLSGNDDLNNIYIDNVYLYDSGEETTVDAPNQAAPTPTQNNDDVLSVYSDAFTDIAGTNLNPDWGQSTLVSGVEIDGDNVLKYSGLDYQGVTFSSSIDVSGMVVLHLDYWSMNSDALNVYLISTGPLETPYVLPVPTSGWNSMDIPLSEFSSVVDLNDIIQMKFDGNGDIYLDNIYFHSGNTSNDSPTIAAPIPSQSAANVISVYGDVYTNLSGTDYPDWGQETVVSDVLIDGNPTLLFAGFNYQGTEFSSALDLSEMSDLHIDYWSANSETLNVYLISPGPAETPYALSVPTSGWNSVDIPLSEFSSVVNLSDVIQMKYDGNGDIYLDNIYFFKE